MTEQGVQLSKEEQALYDRQIRLWGVQTQQRMRSSRILVVGSKGLASEVIKNLVLAGVGQLHIIKGDEEKEASVQYKDLAGNLFFRESDQGTDRLQAQLPRIKEMNPRVEVSVGYENPATIDKEIISNFDIVFVSCCSISTSDHINKVCRSVGIPLPCLVGDTHGLYGFFFGDYDSHEYTVKKDPLNLNDKANEDALFKIACPNYHDFRTKTDWSAKSLRRTSNLLFALLAAYLERENPNAPLDEILAATSIKAQMVNNDLLKTLRNSFYADVSPVCAVVGGLVAQEIIKCISKVDEPIHNFFVFDGFLGTGIVENISCSITKCL